MARKACPPLAGALNLATSLPWQIGGVLALLTYWILHDLSAWMTLGKGADMLLAGLPQYLIPGLLVIVALISFVRGRQRNEPSIDAASSPTTDALARMSIHDFEKLVAEGFRREGFLVVERTGTQHMGCIDLELFMGRDRYLVQCRDWKATAVDAQAVRELYAAIGAERAVGGFIVSSGKFTDEARKIAIGRAIRVVPADSLRRLIKKVTASSTGEVTISPMFSRRRHDPAPPACPKCGKVMMARTKKQNGSVVQVDWGCTSFPACQGSREL
ncbi:MAG: restriction endonuclease [Ferribacterium limneticum]